MKIVPSKLVSAHCSLCPCPSSCVHPPPASSSSSLPPPASPRKRRPVGPAHKCRHGAQRHWSPRRPPRAPVGGLDDRRRCPGSSRWRCSYSSRRLGASSVQVQREEEGACTPCRPLDPIRGPGEAIPRRGRSLLFVQRPSSLFCFLLLLFYSLFEQRRIGGRGGADYSVDNAILWQAHERCRGR